MIKTKDEYDVSISPIFVSFRSDWTIHSIVKTSKSQCTIYKWQMVKPIVIFEDLERDRLSCERTGGRGRSFRGLIREVDPVKTDSTPYSFFEETGIFNGEYGKQYNVPPRRK
jgi:hypothetical protein